MSEWLKLAAQWAEAALRAGIGAFLTPASGDAVNHHRDHGDEDDFDVVGAQANAKVNRKPKVVSVDPVVGVNRASPLSAVLEHGVEVGDFAVNADASLRPVIPERGRINHTWVRVLIGELLIATGRDPDDAGLATFPDRAADLLRDLVR